jgi:hypothetical protein
MKKLIVILVVFALVATAVFAQASVSGTIQYDGYGTLGIGDNAPDHTFNQSVLGNSGVVFAYGAENFSAAVKIKGDNADLGPILGYFDFAEATWKAGGLVDVTAGYGWLAPAYGSGIDFNGNSNWAFGATSVGKSTYLKAGAFGAYLGIWQPNRDAPGILIGYDFTADLFSVGFSALGHVNKANAWGDKFPFLGTLHFAITPGSLAIKLNAGLYGNPGLLSGAMAGIATGGVVRYTEDEMLLEGLFELDYAISDALSVAVTAGYLHNISEEGNNALQIAANLPIKVTGNVSVIPGVIYTNLLKIDNVDSKNSTVDIGVSIAYNF